MSEKGTECARVYLSPGLFGFHTIGGLSYFDHLAKGICRRFEDAGRPIETFVMAASPTASLRYRARQLLDQIASTSRGTSGPIHLVGHSTGGLDARLAAASHARLEERSLSPDIRKRFRSLTTLNTPHYGTPLAKFFASGVGARMQESLWALTAALLQAHARPTKTMSSVALAATLTGRGADLSGPFGLFPWLSRSAWSDMEAAQLLSVDEHDTMGVPINAGFLRTWRRGDGTRTQVMSWLTERMLRALDRQSRGEVHSFLREMQRDQSAILQLTPEAMDLFDATVPMLDGIVYQSVASYVPTARETKTGDPWHSASASLFETIRRITGSDLSGAPSDAATLLDVEGQLIDALGRKPLRRANDGVVPLRSQVYGRLVWVGVADHLDVIGHFDDPGRGHVDWIRSGSGFGREAFDRMLDAVTTGMLDA